MSVEVRRRVDPPGSDEHVGAAWDLKERIRRRDGVLKQRRRFFEHAYRRADVHLLFDAGELIGFAAARTDGYLLFLAVAPGYRGEGLGRRLVASVTEESGTVTCHARLTNEDALEFYERLGFEVVRRVAGYYEDGGDAYYLRLGESASIRERLAELLGGRH